ncbi:facilitated trehalose transporter Tret1-like [Penaeus chinensis]|uniref:facilitated trehalose transporter Tret1-like n=1 Tax=Penaeus chinensis TaxID=139456 RepID=UPI001FB594B0|nr:facilitated trehalose transporter Tret1-like [Penaeus chinensis]
MSHLEELLVSGLCIGVLGTAAQVYIVEVAHETVRGSLTCITDLFVGLGLLFTYILGISGLGWRWSAFTLGLVTNVPLIIGLSLFPDSPRWLATKDRREDAKKALKFLRGSSYDVSSELENIMKAGSSRSKTTFIQQISKLKDPVVYAPFLTGCGVFFFSQLSGPYVVYSYTVHIFQVANAGLSPYLSTVLVGVARVAGSCIGIVVVERAGRRPAMLRGKEGASSSGWLALVSMISFTVILGATISPIPFLLSSELLPLSFRSVGSAATKGVFFLAGLLVVYSFPILKVNVGPDVTFWMYAASALFLVLLVWQRVPETRGRSLEEIEEYYKSMFAEGKFAQREARSEGLAFVFEDAVT